jgi:hypothetical protein
MSHSLHPPYALAVAQVSSETVNMALVNIHNIPSEILSEIMRLYVKDFFSTPYRLGARPRAVLHVCQRWRHTTIDDSICWSIISICFRPTSYLVHPSLATLQDTVNRYFDRSKATPVDLTIHYHREIGQLSKSDFLFWLTQKLPRLRRYTENCSECLIFQIWRNLPEHCYSKMTHLHLEFGELNSQLCLSPKFSLPCLRVLSIEKYLFHMDLS